MAILAVIAGLIVGAAALSLGNRIGADSAFMFRLIALPTLGLVMFAALWLWHRRKSAELIVARYHLRGDALGWRKITLQTGSRVWVCPDCGIPSHDLKSQEAHTDHHQYLDTLADRIAELERVLAEALGGRVREEAEQPRRVPWSAVTEEAVSAEPDPPGPPELPELGEYERKGRAFRESMAQLIRTGGRDNDDAGHDA
jgi:hypothetical protein